jgi:hypothetical protein
MNAINTDRPIIKNRHADRGDSTKRGAFHVPNPAGFKLIKKFKGKEAHRAAIRFFCLGY